ncbi:MAG: ATP-dependent sacrificial sulfur transferase LarE, partial [Myxococcota bacterium]
AHRVLGERAEALTARSASLAGRELEAAKHLARDIGIAHRIVDTRELDRPEYRANAPSRCFYCKDTLFDAAGLLAEASPGTVVVDGFNADDLSDHRPGHAAAAQRGVRHPLAEAHLSKAEIRALSRRAGLATWNKPQLACLSSRVPYGMEVTADRLSRIERMEDVLRDMGFFDVRARLVRENEDMVRLEVGEAELTRAFEARKAVVAAGREIGFRFVALDLEGFRSGRMNEGLVQIRSAG